VTSLMTIRPPSLKNPRCLPSGETKKPTA